MLKILTNHPPNSKAKPKQTQKTKFVSESLMPPYHGGKIILAPTEGYKI